MTEAEPEGLARLARYLLETVLWLRLLDGPAEAGGLAMATAELEATSYAALAARVPEAVPLASAVAHWSRVSGRLDSARDLARAILAHGRRTGSPTARAHGVWGLAWDALHTDQRRAARWFELSERTAEAIGDQHGQVDALLGGATAALLERKTLLAADKLAHADDLCRTMNDVRGAAEAACGQALAAVDAGDAAAASKHFEDARRRTSRVPPPGPPAGEVPRIRAHLGWTLGAAGVHAVAVDRSLPGVQPDQLRNALGMVGDLHTDLNARTESLDQIMRATLAGTGIPGVFDPERLLDQITAALGGLRRTVEDSTVEMGGAVEREVLPYWIYQHVGDRQVQAGLALGRADLARSAGNLEAAEAGYAVAAALVEDTTEGEALVVALRGLAAVASERGQLGLADDRYRAALEACVATRNRPQQAAVEMSLGSVAERSGDPRRAIAGYERAGELYTSLGDDDGISRSSNAIARIRDSASGSPDSPAREAPS